MSVKHLRDVMFLLTDVDCTRNKNNDVFYSSLSAYLMALQKRCLSHLLSYMYVAHC